MTSLAAQLRSVAAASSAQASGIKNRVSLLYTSREAADMSRETVHALSANGIRELLASDSDAFARFERPLFSRAAADYDRLVHTADENAALNATINAFLCALSPRLLTKAAHKCLEWLLRRFSIHLFNGPALLLAALPFHDAPLFARILALVPLDDTALVRTPALSHWTFLRDVQATGAPLERAQLAAQCAQEPPLLDLIGRRGATSSVRAFVNLFAATATATLDVPQVVDESLVLALLPHLLAGLANTTDSDGNCRAAARLVACALAARVQLASETVASLFQALVAPDAAADELDSVVLTLACLLACCPDPLTAAPSAVIERLIALIHLNDNADDADDENDTDAHALSDAIAALPAWAQPNLLLQPLCHHATALIAHTDTAVSARACNLLAALITVPSIAPSLLAHLAQALLACSSSSSSIAVVTTPKKKKTKSTAHAIPSHVTRLLRKLAARHPSAVDEALAGALATNNNSSTTKDLLAFATSFFAHSQHAPLESTTVALALVSPNSSTRALAVAHLIETLSSQTAQSDDQFRAFASQALLDRLCDDSHRVVSTVLQGGPVVASLVPLPPLVQACESLFLRFAPAVAKRAKTLVAIASFLLALPLDSHPDLQDRIRALLWPWLLIRADSAAFNRALIAACASASSSSVLFPGLPTDTESLDNATLVASLSLVSLPSAPLANTDTLHLSELLSTLVLAHHARSETDLERLIALCTDQLKNDPLSLRDASNASEWCTHTSAQPVSPALWSAIAKLMPGNRAGKMVAAVCSVALQQAVPLVTSQSSFSHLNALFAAASLLPPVSFATCVHTLLTALRAERSAAFLAALSADVSLSTVARIRALRVLAPLAAAQPARIDGAALIATLGDAVSEVRVAALACWRALAAAGDTVPRESLARDAIVDVCAAEEHLRADAHHIYTLVGRLIATDPSYFARVSARLSDDIAFLGARIPVALLRCLRRATDIDQDRIQVAAPLLSRSLIVQADLPDAQQPAQCEAIGLLLQCYTPAAFAAVPRSSKKGKHSSAVTPLSVSDLIQPLLEALTRHDVNHSNASVQARALTRLSDPLVAALPVEMARRVVALVIDTAAFHGDTDTGAQARRQLTRLSSADVPVFLPEIEHFTRLSMAALTSAPASPATPTKVATTDSGTPSSKRRARSAANGGVPAVPITPLAVPSENERAAAVARLNVILESMRKPDVLLAPGLIALLEALVAASATWGEYSKQLCLDAVRHSLMTTEEERTVSLVSNAATTTTTDMIVDEEEVRVDVIVRCLRTTNDPQTHRLALLLLTVVAPRYPAAVMEHIMPVFTFMGVSVLRQDDNYSLQVIDECVSAVVPALVQRGTTETIAQVARVFVDASIHIPAHRRTHLFVHLCATLGVPRHLYTLLALLAFRRAATNEAHTAQLATELAQATVGDNAHEQVSVCSRLIALCHRLPNAPLRGRQRHGQQGQSDAVSSVADASLVDAAASTTTETVLQQFKLCATVVVSTLVSSKAFVALVERAHRDQIETDCLSLLQHTLLCREEAPTEAVRRRLLHIADKVNALLPIDAFLAISRQLLVHHDIALRRHMLQVIARRATDARRRDQQQQQKTKHKTDTSEHLITGLLEDVCRVMTTADEPLLNVQTALVTVDAIARAHAKLLPAEFVTAAALVVDTLVRLSTVSDSSEPTTTTPSKKEKDSASVAEVRMSALTCLATLVTQLRARLVSHVGTMVAAATDVLLAAPQHALLSAAASLLISMLVHLPQFIAGPPLRQLLDAVSNARFIPVRGAVATHDNDDDKYNDDEAESESETVSLMQSVRERIATSCSMRLLLPAIISGCEAADGTRSSASQLLLSTLAHAIEHMPPLDVGAHLVRLGRFLVWSLKTRSRHPVRADAVESAAIDCFTALTLRLGEGSFRPLFQRTVTDLINVGVHGQMALYALVGTLARKLRALFTRFFALVLDNAVAVLAQHHRALESTQSEDDEEDDEDEEGESGDAESASEEDFEEVLRTGTGEASAREKGQLVRLVVTALHSCFTHDTSGFVDKKRFALVQEGLVSQLNNALLCRTSVRLSECATQLVIPCLTQLAVAVASEPQWRELNSAVCALTRSPLWRVRLAALQALKALYERLGEEFLPVLPETIPFIAELMEDNVVQVERECQNTIKLIEGYLGESLQQYF